MTKTQYRALVVIAFFMGLVSSYIDLLVPTLLPEGASAVFETALHDMSMLHKALLATLMVVSTIAALFGTYGLLRMRSWAPRTVLFGSITIIPGLVLLGPSVSSGVGVALSVVTSYLWGAALLVPFLREYRHWFHMDASSEVSARQTGGSK